MKTQTKFERAKFNYSGGYLTYEGKFVARFKTPVITMAKFRKELMANHTVESYFAEYASGKAPLQILKSANPTWYVTETNAFYIKNYGKPVLNQDGTIIREGF